MSDEFLVFPKDKRTEPDRHSLAQLATELVIARVECEMIVEGSLRDPRESFSQQPHESSWYINAPAHRDNPPQHQYSYDSPQLTHRESQPYSISKQYDESQSYYKASPQQDSATQSVGFSHSHSIGRQDPSDSIGFNVHEHYSQPVLPPNIQPRNQQTDYHNTSGDAAVVHDSDPFLLKERNSGELPNTNSDDRR